MAAFMKIKIFSILTLTALVFGAIAENEESDSTNDKTIKAVEENLRRRILDDQEFEKNDIQCLIYDRKCNKFLARIKGTVLKALADGCTDCSEDDRKIAGRAVAILLFKQPIVWKTFLSIVDKEQRFKNATSL